jgi:hypothetical protein
MRLASAACGGERERDKARIELEFGFKRAAAAAEHIA